MMKYSNYTWDLVRALDSASPASSKTPASFIDSIHLNNKAEKSKEPRNGIQFPRNRIVLPGSYRASAHGDCNISIKSQNLSSFTKKNF